MKNYRQHSVCCNAGGRKNNRLLNYYQLISGRRNSLSIYFNFIISNFIRLQLWADNHKMPAQQQAVDVVRNYYDKRDNF
ncbi:hypothetical protein A3860_39475 [Niastella vici]|uniref:Uncharacterized protein n=1 Tax=Niastella vici TaxID=1703345 RepID=A0A1V9FK17_9BACT|nr:hypothetical protein A3860_39475 [Niastella vici]